MTVQTVQQAVVVADLGSGPDLSVHDVVVGHVFAHLQSTARVRAAQLQAVMALCGMDTPRPLVLRHTSVVMRVIAS